MEKTVEPAAAVAQSAASWGAILAGAVVAAGVSLLLLALGSGLGFASISPWSDTGVGATTFTVAAAIWLIVMQWVSSGVGGYIAGRLRMRWIGTHVHEVFFRDTAHGLVTWSLATVVVATVVAGSVASGISGGVHAASSMVSGGAQTVVSRAASSGDSSAALAYGIDRVFRSSGSTANVGNTPDPRVEAGRIVMNAVAAGQMPDTDRSYLATLVAAHTGVSEAEAQKRVDDLIAGAKNAEIRVKTEVDAARKGAAEVGIYSALSLLIGAFVASVAAALGGRLRDEHL